jgi:hypothetical protein
MAEDPPQQPVERADEPVQQKVERADESTHLSERGKGLDAMGVPAPVPVWELPDAAQPQASIGGDGAAPQASAQDAAPPDYDG